MLCNYDKICLWHRLQNSNWYRQSIRHARWPLYHHHGYQTYSTVGFLYWNRQKNTLTSGREPWPGSYGKRLLLKRSWVRIPTLDIGWTFFTLICCKSLQCFFGKAENKRKRGRERPIKKNKKTFRVDFFFFFVKKSDFLFLSYFTNFRTVQNRNRNRTGPNSASRDFLWSPSSVIVKLFMDYTYLPSYSLCLVVGR